MRSRGDGPVASEHAEEQAADDTDADAGEREQDAENERNDR